MAGLYICYYGLINIALSFPLSTYFGVYGTAFAVFIAYFMKTFGMVYVLEKKVGLHMKRYFKQTYVKWLLPVFITLLFGLFIENNIAIIGWNILFIKIILITVVYFTLIYFITFEKNDKTKIKNTIKKLYKKDVL